MVVCLLMLGRTLPLTITPSPNSTYASTHPAASIPTNSRLPQTWPGSTHSWPGSTRPWPGSTQARPGLWCSRPRATHCSLGAWARSLARDKPGLDRGGRAVPALSAEPVCVAPGLECLTPSLECLTPSLECVTPDLECITPGRECVAPSLARLVPSQARHVPGRVRPGRGLVRNRRGRVRVASSCATNPTRIARKSSGR